MVVELCDLPRRCPVIISNRTHRAMMSSFAGAPNPSEFIVRKDARAGCAFFGFFIFRKRGVVQIVPLDGPIEESFEVHEGVVATDGRVCRECRTGLSG